MTLLGKWVVDPTDQLAVRQMGQVEMEFYEDGQLFYRTFEGKKIQIMELVYRIEGSTIISNQPTAPREERTPFSISADDVLTLSYGGLNARFARPKSGR